MPRPRPRQNQPCHPRAMRRRPRPLRDPRGRCPRGSGPYLERPAENHTHRGPQGPPGDLLLPLPVTVTLFWGAALGHGGALPRTPGPAEARWPVPLSLGLSALGTFFLVCSQVLFCQGDLSLPPGSPPGARRRLGLSHSLMFPDGGVKSPPLHAGRGRTGSGLSSEAPRWPLEHRTAGPAKPPPALRIKLEIPGMPSMMHLT